MPDIDGGGDDLGIIGTILLAVFARDRRDLPRALLFNVVVIAIELILLLVLFLAGLFGRVVLRKPWTVFAKSGDAPARAPGRRLAREQARDRRPGGRARVRARARARLTGDDWMIDVVVWP